MQLFFFPSYILLPAASAPNHAVAAGCLSAIMLPIHNMARLNIVQPVKIATGRRFDTDPPYRSLIGRLVVDLTSWVDFDPAAFARHSFLFLVSVTLVGSLRKKDVKHRPSRRIGARPFPLEPPLFEWVAAPNSKQLWGSRVINQQLLKLGDRVATSISHCNLIRLCIRNSAPLPRLLYTAVPYPPLQSIHPSIPFHTTAA